MRPQRVKVTGGPSPVNIAVLLDGKKAESISRVVLVLDASEAVRATITHIAQVVFDGEAVVQDTHTVELKERRDAPGGQPGDIIWITTLTGTGQTQAEALRDLARQLDEQERERISGQ